MARKTYKTINNITSYATGLVMKNGTKKYAYFTGGLTHPKFIPSTFTTDDPEIQEKLEKSASYGIKFTLGLKHKAPAAPKKPAGGPELKPFGNTSVQSAVETLVKQGWEGETESLTDVESVQAAGKTVGISFPKLSALA